MSKYQTAEKDKVPFGQKLAFGAGHLVNNLLPGSLGVFSFFLLTAFGMDPFLAGLLGGLPRIYDAISDPNMGSVSDNTQSRWGRRRPYIFVGAIYWWMVKLGQGLALVLGGWVLKVVGFDSNASIQAAETIRNLRLADIIIPVTTASLAILVMWKYDLTEEKASAIKADLVSRRGEL